MRVPSPLTRRERVGNRRLPPQLAHPIGKYYAIIIFEIGSFLFLLPLHFITTIDLSIVMPWVSEFTPESESGPYTLLGMGKSRERTREERADIRQQTLGMDNLPSFSSFIPIDGISAQPSLHLSTFSISNILPSIPSSCSFSLLRHRCTCCHRTLPSALLPHVWHDAGEPQGHELCREGENHWHITLLK